MSIKEFWRGHVEVKKFEGYYAWSPGVGDKAMWTEWWWGNWLVHRRVYWESGKKVRGHVSRDALYGKEILAPEGCFRVRCEREWKNAPV